MTLSLAFTSVKLAQNKLDQALQSLTSNYGAPVTLSNAFTDYCVSVALLRNNASIPDKYKSKYPYWVFNRHASYWDSFTNIALGLSDIAFWSDALECIPDGSEPIWSSLGYGFSFPGDTIHPIWPKTGSTFSNGLDRNLLGSWNDDETQDAFTYTSTSYMTDPLVHQVEDLTCVSYVIPITNG